MKQWLEKTHGPLFELLRHFLSSFFEPIRSLRRVKRYPL
jgi:hypothetical protein